MMKALFHEMAEMELNEAALYYESKVQGLGGAFLREINRSLKQIVNNPEAGPVILKVVRRKLVRRFPYSIMYSVGASTVRILAIASQNRRPFYWRQRK